MEYKNRESSGSGESVSIEISMIYEMLFLVTNDSFLPRKTVKSEVEGEI